MIVAEHSWSEGEIQNRQRSVPDIHGCHCRVLSLERWGKLPNLARMESKTMSDQMTDLADNPLLATGGLPPYDRIETAHIVPAVRHVLAEAEEKLTRLEQNLTPTWSGVIEPLEEIDRPFEFTWRPVTHLFGVKNSPELREAYETVLGEVVQFGLRFKQSEPLYHALKAIKAGEDWESLSETQHRILEDKLLAADLAGIGLAGEKRERFNEIAEELSKLSTQFSNNVLDETKEFFIDLAEKDEVDGLPNSLLQLTAQAFNNAQTDDDESPPPPSATPQDGPWRITLEIPVFMPFMQHSRRRDLREKLYRAFITRASSGDKDNSPLIEQTLQLRQEQAELLGYASYADVSLAEKMAPNVAAVEDMFETLCSASLEAGRQDLQDCQQIANEDGSDEVLAHWDVAFWAERLRETRFDYTDEQLRPYFPQEKVLDGLFDLVSRLFGITVTAADGEAAVWHEDVRFFKINAESGNHIASFFLDPYSRPEDKRGGAWMDECLTRRRIADQIQLPVAQLVCNSTPPVGDIPSLMTFREVETLFHEFGHGLQHMLTRIDEADASGINGVEWDAVELPSQFMENWCYHRPTVMEISGHYETGEPLPDDLFEKLKAARTFRAGTLMLRQLLFGMTDMHLHHNYDPSSEQSVFEVQRSISEKTSVLPQLPEDRSLCSFQHIFAGGYAAGYYSYKWAEVLSADAFSAFEDVGLDNEDAVRETGRRFRDTVLAQGGSRHPMEIYKEFRGREPNTEALLRHCGLA